MQSNIPPATIDRLPSLLNWLQEIIVFFYVLHRKAGMQPIDFSCLLIDQSKPKGVDARQTAGLDAARHGRNKSLKIEKTDLLQFVATKKLFLPKAELRNHKKVVEL